MKIDADEITNFVNGVKNGIAKSEENEKFELMSNIDFELSVITKKQGKAKASIAIVGAGGEYEKQAVSKIKFSMGNEATSKRGLAVLEQLFSVLTQLENPPQKSLPKPKKKMG